jgi:hypothetical protein
VTREELLALIDSLNPEAQEIAAALGFIRLVVKNNPMKTAEQIRRRSDVQQALRVIEDWVKSTEEATVQALLSLPVAKSKIAQDVGKTLDQFEAETDITDENLDTWRVGEQTDEAWTASMLLRMTWLVEWLRKLVEGLTLTTPYKVWRSRLADNTCKWCRALHGTVLPAGKSFAPTLLALGYPKKYLYGGLYAPGLHPRCACWLEGVSQTEYQTLVDTSGEEG